MFSPNSHHSNTQDRSLFTKAGQRKYLTADERKRFLKAASKQPESVRLFCEVLLHSGCRISEVLAIETRCILIEEGLLAIRSLKKRNKPSTRLVPMPEAIICDLVGFTGRSSSLPIWKWKRTWAWTIVKGVMSDANIEGPHATPRGLRHGFGVHAIQSGVPLNMVQRWLGHADISTTAIYTNAVGPEERALARRMW